MTQPTNKRNYIPGLLSGLAVGVFTSLLTFGLNQSNASKNDLKKALDEKASIEYVDKCILNHMQVQKATDKGSDQRMKNIETQVNLIYELLLKNSKK